MTESIVPTGAPAETSTPLDRLITRAYYATFFDVRTAHGGRTDETWGPADDLISHTSLYDASLPLADGGTRRVITDEHVSQWTDYAPYKMTLIDTAADGAQEQHLELCNDRSGFTTIEDKLGTDGPQPLGTLAAVNELRRLLALPTLFESEYAAYTAADSVRMAEILGRSAFHIFR